MTDKKTSSSTGYFNKEMQAILKKGESKTPGKKKTASLKKKGK